jgi:hypothetical protein
LVEHATENRSVGGSIPPLGTINLIVFSVVTEAGILYRSRAFGDRAGDSNSGIPAYTDAWHGSRSFVGQPAADPVKVVPSIVDRFIATERALAKTRRRNESG